MTHSSKILDPLVRHQCAAELLACSVRDLFPTVQFVDHLISDIGFSYDFLFESMIQEDVLILIEEKIRELLKKDFAITPLHMMRENAMTFFNHHQQPYLASSLELRTENIVSLCRIGDFHDLCFLPHEVLTSDIGVIKLLNLEQCQVFQEGIGNIPVVRIHGTAFSNKMELKRFLKKAEAAKKQDHRILGLEMQLFGSDDLCLGCYNWYPKGTYLRHRLMESWQNIHRHQGFQLIKTSPLIKPSLLKEKIQNEGAPLFHCEGQEYQVFSDRDPLLPMIFRSKSHFHYELPIRYCEISDRFEKGKNRLLWGLLRARSYSSDTAYTFCSSLQLQKEIISSLQFIAKTIKIYGFEHRWYLNTRGQKAAGTVEEWRNVSDLMREAFKRLNIDYSVNTTPSNFSGPQVEMRLFDAWGREWKGPSLCVNFDLPKRFNLCYEGPDGQLHMPMMLTRSLFGSLERFIAILIEHHTGLLPLWLAPEQVRIIPVSVKNAEYAKEICSKFECQGFRVSTDYRNENLGAKIHAAEREKIPYMIVVGDQEEKKGTITVRSCYQEAKKIEKKLESFLEEMHQETKINFEETI